MTTNETDHIALMKSYVTDTLNLDLLVQVRDQIAAHPDQHDQGHYEHISECGTSRCMAGWTGYLLGLTRGEVLHLPGYYDGVASRALGIVSWEAQRGSDDHPPTMFRNHPFYYRWSHEDTLRNLDALISLAKDQEDQA